MVHITGEVTIDAPVEEVFDIVADERNEPRYNPRIVRAELLTGEPVGVGSRYVAEPRNVGAKGRMFVETKEFERPHRLYNVITSPVMRIEGSLTFEPAGGGMRLRWDWELRLLGWMRVLSPVLALVGPRWERRNWVDLKHFVESRRVRA